MAVQFGNAYQYSFRFIWFNMIWSLVILFSFVIDAAKDIFHTHHPYFFINLSKIHRCFLQCCWWKHQQRQSPKIYLWNPINLFICDPICEIHLNLLICDKKNPACGGVTYLNSILNLIFYMHAPRRIIHTWIKPLCIYI